MSNDREIDIGKITQHHRHWRSIFAFLSPLSNEDKTISLRAITEKGIDREMVANLGNPFLI